MDYGMDQDVAGIQNSVSQFEREAQEREEGLRRALDDDAKKLREKEEELRRIEEDHERFLEEAKRQEAELRAELEMETKRMAEILEKAMLEEGIEFD